MSLTKWLINIIKWWFFISGQEVAEMTIEDYQRGLKHDRDLELNSEIFNRLKDHEKERAWKTLVFTVSSKTKEYTFVVLDEQLKKAYQILQEDRHKCDRAETDLFFESKGFGFKKSFDASKLLSQYTKSHGLVRIPTRLMRHYIATSIQGFIHAPIPLVCIPELLEKWVWT